jgi:GNAT superfamily N-acetyltransferase
MTAPHSRAFCGNWEIGDKVPSMSYAVREARSSDLPMILHHRRQMFRDMGYTNPAALDAMQKTTEPLLARGLAEGFYRGWLVEDEGCVVAGGGVFIADWPSHPRGVQTKRVEIVNVYTEPEHRRRGLARLMMEAILTWCRAKGFGTVVLHASDHGRALYESLGFNPTNEMRLALKRD